MRKTVRLETERTETERNRIEGSRTGRAGESSIRRIILLMVLCCLLTASCAKRDAQTEQLYEQALMSEESQGVTGEQEAGTEDGADTEQTDGESSVPEEVMPASGEEPVGVSPEKLYVHVCGAVACPGVYEFSDGARCCEAVERAGGFAAEADPDQVNLARKLQDGQKLYIPYEGEQLTAAEAGAQEEAAGDGAASEAAGEASGRVNINMASKEELQTLPGIGPARAESIIAYREAKGGFQSVEEIQQIEGIKEKSYEKLRDYITVK